MYQLLANYEVGYSKEESDQVGDLRYSWRKLLSLTGEVNNTLAELQVGFKKDLVRNVKLFLQDVEKFRYDFETNGPMSPGITPMEATDRLKRFQLLLEQRERKYAAYSNGEHLFGLPATGYPELDKTRKELDLLERLYSLYLQVYPYLYPSPHPSPHPYPYPHPSPCPYPYPYPYPCP